MYRNEFIFHIYEMFRFFFFKIKTSNKLVFSDETQKLVSGQKKEKQEEEERSVCAIG